MFYSFYMQIIRSGTASITMLCQCLLTGR